MTRSCYCIKKDVSISQGNVSPIALGASTTGAAKATAPNLNNMFIKPPFGFKTSKPS